MSGAPVTMYVGGIATYTPACGGNRDVCMHVEGIATYSNENCQTCRKPVCLIVVLPSVGRNIRLNLSDGKT